MKRAWMTFAVAALLAGSFPGAGFAQNEQGQQQGQQQQQKSPLTDIKISDAIASDVVYVIKQRIAEQTQNNMFTFTDPKTKDKWMLQYQSVDEGSVKMLKPDMYVAQGKFQTQEGQEVVLDFFVEGADRSEMKVTRATVFSMDGKKMYEWEKTQGDMYRQKPMEGGGSQQGGSMGGSQSGSQE